MTTNEKDKINKIAGLIIDGEINDGDIRKSVENFIEVYVRCPVRECIQRDVKGMYALAKKGKIKNFTGLDGPYEKPKRPEIKVNTSNTSLEECVLKIWTYLREEYYGCE